MFHTFNAPTADILWQQVRDTLCDGSDVAAQSGRGGETRELLHVGMSIENPRQRWVVSREPALNPAFAIAEVIWILRGRRDSAFLNYFNHQLCRFAGEGEIYHGAYGYRLTRHFGVNQLDRAYSALRSQGDSRQIVLQMWDAASDLPLQDGSPASPDVPCNITSLLKLRGGRLEWLQVMRSNDVFRGLPHNIVQFTMLQEVMAGWLGVKLGSYNHISDSLHLYVSDRSNLSSSAFAPAAFNEDSCALPKGESESAWATLETAVERILNHEIGVVDLIQQIQNTTLLPAFRNMLCVLSAEGIRRRGKSALAQAAMEGCSNRALVQLWERWKLRLEIAREPEMASVR